MTIQAKHRTTNRKKLKVVSLAAAPILIGLGVVAVQPAFAGTNGQIIELCQGFEGFQKATVTGPNQNGEPTTASLALNPVGAQCGRLEGFFWKGTVNIHWEGGPNGATTDSTCDVPESSQFDTELCRTARQR